MPESAPGPLDDGPWPHTLDARVVAPGDAPRIFGYATDEDLVQHYDVGACVGLALTGELLDETRQRALDAAMIAVAPVAVNQAACHVGLLARVSATTVPSTIAATTLGLAQAAHHDVARHAPWLEWLDAGSPGTPPPGFESASVSERGAAEALSLRLASFAFSVPALACGPTRVAAVVAVMHACGLTRDAMVTAMVTAQLPIAMAEALARPTLGMRDYPMNVPRFEYEEDA